MRINVLFSPSNVDELFFSGKTTVVIDVLRATSVIITALSNGAKEVIPVSSIEFAMKVSGNAFGGHTLLGGERNTKMIEGFSLGNSPLEYTPEAVSGKSIILFTTNGSKAVVRAKFSETLLIASLLNVSSTASALISNKKDIEILCAGSNGMFCIEDTVCAGKIIKEMEKFSGELKLTDSARVAKVMDDNFGADILGMLKDTEHGRLLHSNGFEADLGFCSRIDSIPIVPAYSVGIIKSVPLDHHIKN